MLDKIKKELIEFMKSHPEELPLGIPPEFIFDALECAVKSIYILTTNSSSNIKTSEGLGISAEELDKIRNWCKSAVLNNTKVEVLLAAKKNIESGWRIEEALYAAYWLGLYEGCLRLGVNK